MALPVSPDPTDRRAAVLRMLEASPDGLSDAALAQALGDGTRPQTVNQLCRRLVAEGALERVGTRPILNRLPAPPARRRGRKTTGAPPPEAPPTELRARGAGGRRTGTAAPSKNGRAAADVTTPTPDASETEAAPATEAAPVATRRGRNGTRSTSARTTADVTTPTPDASTTEASPATDPDPAVTRSTTAGATPNASKTEASPAGEAPLEPQGPPAAPAKPKRRKQSPAPSATPEHDSARKPDEAEPAPDVVTATTSSGEAEAPTCGPPPFDALQAWSRVANVQALVADWLVRRGATLRSATLAGNGPTRDLVASVDGDDVHVEVTGWPADGARTHPTTIAGDWFSGAEQAAAQRRRAHPRARIVIALPDTRRYRSLTEQRATSLAGAGAEVWFVDPAGSIEAR